MTILEALDDANLLGPAFPDASWDAWRAFLAATFGLPTTASMLAQFEQCTGRSTPRRTRHARHGASLGGGVERAGWRRSRRSISPVFGTIGRFSPLGSEAPYP